MLWGLIILYIFAFIGLLVASNKHGQQREPWNFWSTFIANILHFLLIWWALDWKFI